MALIKCPECGKDVSTAAEICPHCGYPIRKLVDVVTEQTQNQDNDYLEEPKATTKKRAPKPIDPSWMTQWKNKPGTEKAVWSIFFIICIALLLIFIFAGAYIAAAVFGFITFVIFVCWIAALIGIKHKVVSEDGYNIVAVAGFIHNYLVIEDEVQDKGLNRHLDGKLPNGKHVWADFAVWDNSIKISIDERPYNEHGRRNQ